MAELGWILLLFLRIPVLQITAADTLLSFIVRLGDEVSLPCDSGIKHMLNCDDTTWLFSALIDFDAVELVKHGKIEQSVRSKSDRLSVTENCSLVIKKVTREDVGQYTCRQFISGQQRGGDSMIHLSVVTMTEQKNNDKVTLNCSVSKDTDTEECRHTVKWLYAGKDVDKDNNELKTSQSHCSASVTFSTSHFIYTSKKFDLLKCESTDGYNRKANVFSPQAPESRSLLIFADWWWYLIVAVALAALLITIVALVRWKRNKANKTQTDNKAAPEDGLSYAFISFPKKSSSRAWVWGKSNAVIYSSVKAGGSTDPSNIYAAIN